MRKIKVTKLVIPGVLSFWLFACAADPPIPESVPAIVESPRPELAPVDRVPSPEPTQQLAEPAPNRVAVLDPESGETARVQHRQALLAASADALDTSEVGYYIDILEARLTQQLREDNVLIRRDGNSFTLLIAGSDAFDSDQSQLKPGVRGALAAIAGVLEEYRNTQIAIYGHTDDSGGEVYNQKLSERRAQSVADYLVAEGIDAQRILIVGYGESRPLVPNVGEEARRRNRRIEVQLEPLAR